MSTHKGRQVLSDSFEFPLDFDTSSKSWTGKKDGIEVDATIKQGMTRAVTLPFPTTSGSKIVTTQNSNGNMLLNEHHHIVGGVARTAQVFDYSDDSGATYHRDVQVFNRTQFIKDVQSGSLAPARILESNKADVREDVLSPDEDPDFLAQMMRGKEFFLPSATPVGFLQVLKRPDDPESNVFD